MTESIIELQDVHVRYKTRTSGLFVKNYVDALAGSAASPGNRRRRMV